MPSPFESELLRRPPLVTRPYRFNLARLPFPFSLVSEILDRENRRLGGVDSWQLRVRFAAAGAFLALPLVVPASSAFLVPALYFLTLQLLGTLCARGISRVRFCFAPLDAVAVCAFSVLSPAPPVEIVVLAAIVVSVVSAGFYGRASAVWSAGLCWLIVSPALAAPLVTIPVTVVAVAAAYRTSQRSRDLSAERTLESLARLEQALSYGPIDPPADPD